MHETSILLVIYHLLLKAYPKEKFRVKWHYHFSLNIPLFKQFFQPNCIFFLLLEEQFFFQDRNVFPHPVNLFTDHTKIQA